MSKTNQFTALGSRRAEGQTNRQAHAQLPENTLEREIGREGFFGQCTHMYHQNPPTGWLQFEGPLQPKAFNCVQLTSFKPVIDTTAEGILPTNTPFAAAELLVNQHTRLQFWHLNYTMERLCRNADGDWLLFVHAGAGDLFCDYGHMPLTTGDYCVLPKGTLWRLEATSKDMQILLIEATEAAFTLPDKGILGPHALFDPALLEAPKINEKFKQQYCAPLGQNHAYKVVVKKRGLLSQITYPFNPLDAIGWHGDLMPTKINVSQIRPVLSHRYHLPPSAHTTFVTPHFIVCTFTPRPFETEADALKIPFFHSNDDYDEVLFYHKGDFFSRDHIEPGMITFHPAGFTHGPHPKALKNMLVQTKPATDEYAVMLDSRMPLQLGKDAPGIEIIEYAKSWQG